VTWVGSSRLLAFWDTVFDYKAKTLKPIELPTLNGAQAALPSHEIEPLKQEVRALAEERDAVILAHNYQVPEVQDVADFVGDSLGLSRQAAATDSEVIAFCGVHFMAETASILSPEKTVLLPDLDAGCSLADSITADQLRAWKAKHPGALVVMYVNTSAEVKAETDYCCTSSNAVQVVEHIWREHGEDTEILFGPDMWLGAYVERETGRRMHVWDGECHVHAGIRPADIADVRAEHPGAEFMIHPECGCTTQVMEYVAAGDVDADHTHMLSTSGMLNFAARSEADEFIVATETGMLYPLEDANPGKRFVPANEAAVCRYMKMITLPKLRDALRELAPVVKVAPEIAERARVPIERMVAIGG
jgi:quinolinate synthase